MENLTIISRGLDLFFIQVTDSMTSVNILETHFGINIVGYRQDNVIGVFESCFRNARDAQAVSSAVLLGLICLRLKSSNSGSELVIRVLKILVG